MGVLRQKTRLQIDREISGLNVNVWRAWHVPARRGMIQPLYSKLLEYVLYSVP